MTMGKALSGVIFAVALTTSTEGMELHLANFTKEVPQKIVKQVLIKLIKKNPNENVIFSIRAESTVEETRNDVKSTLAPDTDCADSIKDLLSKYEEACLFGKYLTSDLKDNEKVIVTIDGKPIEQSLKKKMTIKDVEELLKSLEKEDGEGIIGFNIVGEAGM